MHPTSYSRDNLPGFLSIVQIGNSLDHLLSWVPEIILEGTPDYERYVLVEEAGNDTAGLFILSIHQIKLYTDINIIC